MCGLRCQHLLHIWRVSCLHITERGERGQYGLHRSGPHLRGHERGRERKRCLRLRSIDKLDRCRAGERGLRLCLRGERVLHRCAATTADLR